jgi:uncharacterized protein YraI
MKNDPPGEVDKVTQIWSIVQYRKGELRAPARAHVNVRSGPGPEVRS